MRQISSSHKEHESRRLAEDLGNLARLTRQGWYYLVAGAALGLTLAAVYIARSEVSYKASTRLLVLRHEATRLNPTAEAVRADESGDHLATHILIIRSPLVVRRAIDTVGRRDLSVASVIGDLTVTRPDPDAKVLQLEYKSDTKKESEEVAEAVSQSYREFLEENFQEKSHDVVAMMTRARDSLSVELREMEHRYLESRRESAAPAVDASGQPLLGRRLVQWEEELNQATLRAFRLRTQLELGRKLAEEGAGVAAIAQAIRRLGGDLAAEAVGDPATSGAPSAAGAALRRITDELAEVEFRRKTAERLLEHLRSENDLASAARSVSESHVARAFQAEPTTAELRSMLDDAMARVESVGRVVRRDDPALTRARRQADGLKDKLVALWNERAPLLRAELAEEAASGPSRDSLEKADAELMALRATERALNDRLEQETEAELLRLARDRRALAARIGEDHPSVKEIETRRAELEAGGSSDWEATRTGDFLRALERDLAAVERMQEGIRASSERDGALAREAEYSLLADANRRNDLDRHRALYQGIVDQLKQAQLARDLGSTTAQVINPVAVAAVRPSALLVLALALLGGLALGGSVAWLADQLDGRLRSLGEIRKVLDLSVLGTIPRLPGGRKSKTEAVGTIAHAIPRSLIAESYRAIRTNLEFLRRHKEVQVILVSSPNPGDGKSTTASNLAISLAQAGRGVLLVDADLRRPTLHSLYGEGDERGLVDVLRGEATVARVTRPTPTPGLEFLAAGAIPPDPAELLASSRFSRFLEDARRTHDVVIIDSSPMLAVTDASIIGAMADGIILVVNAGAVRRADADRTSELLKALGTPVLGVVVNATTRDQQGYGYGYGYGYGHGYGYGNAYGYGHGKVYGEDSTYGQATEEPASLPSSNAVSAPSRVNGAGAANAPAVRA